MVLVTLENDFREVTAVGVIAEKMAGVGELAKWQVWEKWHTLSDWMRQAPQLAHYGCQANIRKSEHRLLVGDHHTTN